MQGKFADNPYYVEYEAQLKRLHRMIAEGMGDSDEADALRDEMDRPERQLSYEEMQRLRGLSADLYMLQDDEVYEPLRPGEDPAERAPDRLRERVTEAWERGDAEATLALLRKGPTGLTQDQVAHIRSWAYEALGHLDTALLFLQHAAEQDPAKSHYKAGALALLALLDQRDQLYRTASDYLQDDSASPELRVYAASLLSGLARKMSPEQSTDVARWIVGSLEPALHVLEQTGSTAYPDLPYVGQLALGFCHQRLGNRQEALNAFGKAMGSPKMAPRALIARSLLLMDEQPQQALLDLQKAVETGTSIHIPYVYLAHHALENGDYAGCLKLSSLALDRTGDPRLKAVLLQWQAIAGFELGLPLDALRRAFETALQIDPLNPRIRHNFEVFRQREQAQSGAAVSPAPWHPPATPPLEAPEVPDAARLVAA